MRRHVTGSSTTERARTTSGLLSIGTRPRTGLVHRCHGILERTAGRKVLATADTALDLLVLELILHAALLSTGLLLLLGLRLPVHAGPEGDILAHGCRVEGRTRGVTLLEPELRPPPPLRDARVHVFLDYRGFDPSGHLDFLAVVVEAVRDDRFRAILVRRDLLRGERGRVVKLLVIGPVGAAEISALEICRGFDSQFYTHLASLDMLSLWCAEDDEFLGFKESIVDGPSGLQWCGALWLMWRVSRDLPT